MGEVKPLHELLEKLLKKTMAVKQAFAKFNGYYIGDEKDEGDMLLAQALLRRNSRLGEFLTKLSPGKYMLNGKIVISKVFHGQLIIRVGGGYMSIDEFIDQYAHLEHMKLKGYSPQKGTADMPDMG
jgi:hypothetical protein